MAYHGRIWDVVKDEFPYGQATLTREYVAHPGAVAILALDEAERVLLINQYRHPVRSMMWEIPAGLLDVDGESPLAAARRELAEETDLVARDWAVLGEYYTTPGSSSEAIRIYLARGIAAAERPFEREAEEADIRLRWVPLEAAVTAVLGRRIQNPSAVVGLLAAYAARSRGWQSLAEPDAPWERHPRWHDGRLTSRDAPARP
ncbi:MAG TPA: NUDIX hydrolase [Microbacteriaceae bacterium]|nr:NUDIX hydrolase [Microbacteriaceae bacterium]